MKKTPVLTAPLFTNWRQLLEAVYQGRPTYEFKRGCDIQLHPRDVWMVCRGVVQLSSIHGNGNEALLGLIFPDMPFGLPLTRLDPYVAIALSDVVLMRLSQTELERSSELTQGIQLQLHRRLQQTEELLALVNQRPVCYRLQLFLLLLAREVGQRNPDGVRIEVRLTHLQIAHLLGTTRISVTRLLGYLQKEGWLSIDKSHHLIIHKSVAFDLRS